MLDRWMNDDEWRLKVGGIALAIILVAIGIYYVATYRYVTTATVIATNWQLEIGQLQYQTLQESDWSVPNGGRVDHRKWEQYGTERYVSGSHTETRSGGTYSCGTTKNPKTCKYPDTKVTVTDYSTRPTYAWRYYYYIDRWVNIAPLVTSGTDKEDVHWPDTTDHTYNEDNTIGNIKLGTRHSHYWIIVTVEGKQYSIDMIDAMWKEYAKRDTAKLTLGYFNNVIAIEKGW